MGFVLTLAGRKGGTSKTTTVMALAGAIQADKETALLVDLDPQGSLTKQMLLRHTKRNVDSITSDMTAEALQAGHRTVEELAIPLAHCPGLSLIPARPEMTLRAAPLPLRDAQQSIVLVDTAPDTRSGDTQAALLSTDAVLLPCQPTALSMGTLPLTIDSLADVAWDNPRLITVGIVLTQVQPRKITVQEDCISMLRRVHGHQLLDAVLPYAVEFQECAALGITPWTLKKRGKAAKASAALWAEVLQRIMDHNKREAA